jgi:hypothetical protein
MKKINILLFLAALVAFSACKDDDDNTPTGNGTLNVELEHSFGADAFELNSANFYTTAAGEQVKFNTLKYYISNVVLTKSTKIIDVSGDTPIEYKGRVPARSVVIPGSYNKKFPAGDYQVSCALIIGQRKPSTDLKTSLNDALRDFNVAV